MKKTILSKFCRIALALGAIAFSTPFTSPSLSAREPTVDVVYFIDGSLFSGVILDINRNRIRIQHKDGRVFEFPTKNIYKFSSVRHFREIYRQSIEKNP